MQFYYWNVRIFSKLKKNKNRYQRITLVILSVLFFSGCGGDYSDNRFSITNNIMRHAQMINAERFEAGVLLEVNTLNSKAPKQFFLHHSDLSNDEKLPSINYIKVPVDGIVTLSSTQWAPLVSINKSDLILGISEADYVQNSTMRSLLNDGSIIEVMKNGVLDFEQTVKLQADLLLYSPMPGNAEDDLIRTGLTLLPWPDYLENTPLGRAEWIRVLGWLSGSEEITEEWFSTIEKEYLSLKSMIHDSLKRPSLMADKAFNEQWFVPGGKSYLATIFGDAGANYIWADNESTGSVSFDIETILSEAANADYWRIAHATSDSFNYEALRQEKEIYANFKAYQERNIIFCNTLKTAYFEKSTFEPQIVLADFIAIFHPDLLPNHKAVYHKILNQ